MVSVRYLFSVKIGQIILNSSNRKRAPTQNVKYHKLAFRSDNIKKHAEQQHLKVFAEYSRLGDADEMTNFDIFIARNNSLLAHFDGENSLRFVINKNIIGFIVGKMLFDSDYVDASLTGMRALVVYKLFEDANWVDDAEEEDVNIENYEVKIASYRFFDVVLGYAPYGCSFQMASRLVENKQSVSKIGCFSGCTEWKCAMYARVICAANLQKPSKML